VARCPDRPDRIDPVDTTACFDATFPLLRHSMGVYPRGLSFVEGVAMRSISIFSIVVGALVLAPVASADPIVFQFTGSVVDVSSQSPTNPAGIEVDVGDPLLGTITLEPDTPPQNFDDSASYTGSILALTLDFGNTHVEATKVPGGNNSLDIFLPRPPTPSGTYIFEFVQTTGIVVNGQSLPHLHFYLDLHSSLVAPTDLSFPLTPPDPDDFPVVQAYVNLAVFSPVFAGIFVDWSMDTFTLVPEPASGSLLALGVAAGVALGRSPRRARGCVRQTRPRVA